MIRSGGAPEWIVEKWVDFVLGKSDVAAAGEAVKDQEPVLDLLRAGLQKVAPSKEVATVVVVDQLLGVESPEAVQVQPPGEPAAEPAKGGGVEQPDKPEQKVVPAPAPAPEAVGGIGYG